jgi:hypothetical protein
VKTQEYNPQISPMTQKTLILEDSVYSRPCWLRLCCSVKQTNNFLFFFSKVCGTQVQGSQYHNAVACGFTPVHQFMENEKYWLRGATRYRAAVLTPYFGCGCAALCNR